MSTQEEPLTNPKLLVTFSHAPSQIRTNYSIRIVVKFYYHIRLIKRTVRVEVGKIFCRRGFVKHPFNRIPKWLPIG